MKEGYQLTVRHILKTSSVSMKLRRMLIQDVSAPESLWRLYAYRMHERSHRVYRLAVHLDLEQNVVFVEGSEREALENALNTHSHLTAWFELNKSQHASGQYKYAEIPQHCIPEEWNE